MSLPLATALENVRTHQCEFTRGYWVGFTVAKAATESDFDCEVPEAFHADVLAVLPAAASVETGDSQTNGFSVAFVSISVKFPLARVVGQAA